MDTKEWTKSISRGIPELTGIAHFFSSNRVFFASETMADYLGLLVSVTEGLEIPKKKVFLSVCSHHRIVLLRRFDTVNIKLHFQRFREGKRRCSTRDTSSATTKLEDMTKPIFLS